MYFSARRWREDLAIFACAVTSCIQVKNKKDDQNNIFWISGSSDRQSWALLDQTLGNWSSSTSLVSEEALNSGEFQERLDVLHHDGILTIYMQELYDVLAGIDYYIINIGSNV